MRGREQYLPLGARVAVSASRSNRHARAQAGTTHNVGGAVVSAQGLHTPAYGGERTLQACAGR